MNSQGKVAHVLLALAALTMSGFAAADHSPGHGKEQTKGPKSSVRITNSCTLSADKMTTSGVPKHLLEVTTVIENESGDNSTAFTVDSKTVTGEQSIKNDDPPKKQEWKEVGGDATQSADNPYQVHIDLCQGVPLQPGTKALNATVQVEVDGRFFLSRCDDDPETVCYRDDGTEYVCEEKDESIVLPVDEYGDPISCAPR